MHGSHTLTLHRNGGLVRLVAHSVHACTCVCTSCFLRSCATICSYLHDNLVGELPAQIFDMNVELTELCVDLHCLVAMSGVGGGDVNCACL